MNDSANGDRAKRADAVANRDHIVEVARRLITQRGEFPPYRRIATEAGVGVATLHRHFPERSDLLEAVTNRTAVQIREMIDAATALWPQNPWGTWRDIVQGIAALKPAVIGVTVLGTEEFIDDIDDLPDYFRHRVRQFTGNLLEKAADHGFVSPNLEPERFYIGLALCSRPLPDRVEEIVPGYISWSVDRYLEGLKPR